MSSVRDWTTGFAVIGTILLGPIIAFLTVVAAEVLIDFLKERAVIAALAVCAVVAGMIGWVLASSRSRFARRGSPSQFMTEFCYGRVNLMCSSAYGRKPTRKPDKPRGRPRTHRSR
jgi:hypothetical protein